jgi:septal ring factor EnvC (AmiA/AmiB activator)
MKLYRDYKKLFNTILTAQMGIMIILLLIPLAFSYAQTAVDIQNKISQKDTDIAQLEQEITAYQAQLDVLGQQKSSLNSSLKALDLTSKKLNADITVTQKKIDKTSLSIQNLSSDIGNKENSIKNNTDSIKLEIKNTNEVEQSSLVENLLSNNDFSVIWNDIDNIATVRESLRADTIKLNQLKSVLEDTRKTTIDAKNQLTELKSQLSDQQKIVAQNTNDKNNLLKQTKNSEANYQKLLKDRIAKRDAFELEIQNYESQLKFILDPSKLPQGRVLSWPLDKIFVTQLFGKTVDSKRLYISGTHSGVDFKASIGTRVMSMADGTVLGTGNTELTW